MDVRLPSGKIIKNVPEGTSKLEIAQKAVSAGLATPEDFGGFVPEPFTPNQTPDAGINPIAGNLEALLSGATGGFSDEGQAALGALYSGLAGAPEGMGFLERYRTIRDQIRKRAEQFREQEGAAAIVPELVGGLATGGLGLAKAGGGLGTAMKVGAIEGGIAGAGYSDAPLGGETVQDAVLGAGAGAIAAPVAQVAGRAAKGIFNKGKGVIDRIRVPKRYAQQMADFGVPDDEMAKYVIKGNKAKIDPLYKEANRQGVSDSLINNIKSGSAADRNAAKEMLEIIKKGRKSKNYARTRRAGDVAGRTVEQQLKHIDDVNQKARIRLNQVAEGLKDKPINLQDVWQEFGSQMDSLGIRISTNKSGKTVVDFDQSLLTAKEDFAPVKRVIQRITAMMEGGVDAHKAHRIKRIIDNSLPYGKTSEMSGDALKLLRGLRANIDNALDQTYPEYDKANIVLRDTIEALKTAQDAAGSNFNLHSDGAASQLGTRLRRLMGNAETRETVRDALNLTEEVARKYGYKGEGSAIKQAFLVDDFEDFFGSSSQTGFRTEVQKAIIDARSPKDAAAEIGRRAIESAEGISEDAAIRILERMLDR